MKLTLLLLIVFTISAYSQESPTPIPLLDSMTIKKAAFIGLVKINEMVDDLISGDIIQSFKVNKILDEQVLFRVENDRLDFNPGSVYLVFAQNDVGMRYYLNEDSRILRQEDSENDITYLLSILPCFDPKLKERRRGCHRIYKPVCGCNLKTYNTPCDALENGIVLFTKGECK